MDWTNYADAELISGSLDDPEMFGVIFERHHDPIFRFVARRQHRDRAPDLTSEVFMRAFKFRTKYDGSRPNCRPWLYGIATNIVGDEIRRTRRSERIFLAVAGLRVGERDEYELATDRVSAQNVQLTLNSGLARLANGDRNVLLLYAVEQLSYQEIADALQIPIGTVRSRLARARRKLRQHAPQLEQELDHVLRSQKADES